MLAGPLGLLLLIACGIGLLAAVTEIGQKVRLWRYQRGSYDEQQTLLGWRQRSGFDRETIRFAGLVLTVPKFFVTRAYRVAEGAAEARKVEFEIRLPGFRPYGPDSAAQYTADPASRLQIALLSGDEAQTPEAMIAAAVASGHREHPNPVPDGAVHLAARSQFEEWAYAYTKADGYKLLAVCARATTENACTARFMLRPGIAVDYRFARTPYLAQWPAIDAKLRSLLESFVAP